MKDAAAREMRAAESEIFVYQIARSVRHHQDFNLNSRSPSDPILYLLAWLSTFHLPILSSPTPILYLLAIPPSHTHADIYQPPESSSLTSSAPCQPTSSPLSGR